MSPDTPCPSTEILRRSLDPDDPMSEPERRRIEAHVDRCDKACKAAIEALLRGGTLPPTPGGNGSGVAPRGSAAAEPRGDATWATDAPTPSIGPLTVPGYEILEEIGRGGMGVVYKARQVRLNRLAAVKMILAGSRASPDAHARFQTEAEVVAALRHPNIVQIYEVGEHDRLPFLSLEFMEGGNLSQKTAGKSQPPRAAAETVEILARAVHFAHGRGLIHRDLKPANVLLTADGVLKITDFGLARRLEGDSGQTKTGEVLGTPSYMAPEQAVPGPSGVGPPADVYALGAILYELLTGRPPFRGATPWDVLVQVQSAEPVPPRRLAPKTPADLETICLKCLQKEPQRRYGSAEALADDLRRFLSDRTIQARPAGTSERLWRWSRRNPALAIAAGLAAAAVIALVGLSIGFGVYQGRAADDLRREQKQTEAAKDRAVAAEGKAQGLVQELQKANRDLSVRLLANRGQSNAEQGEAAEGMLWLAHGLETASPDMPDWEYVLRKDLDCWRGRMQPLRAVLGHPDGVRSSVFSPDGKAVLTASLTAAWLWDAATGRPIGSPMRQHDIHVAVFSPDGTKVLTAGEGGAQLWDAATREPIGAPMPHQGAVLQARFSPNGETVLTTGTDKTARLWDAQGRPLGEPIQHPDEIYCAVFSPDSKTILIGGKDGTARLWNASTREPIGDPLRHESARENGGVLKGAVNDAVFSPDGNKVVTAGGDFTARLWDAHTGRPLNIPPLPFGGERGPVRFSPDGRTILTVSDNKWGGLGLWDAETGKPKSCPTVGNVAAAAFSPDGRTILTGSSDRTARLWDAATADPLGPPLYHQDTVTVVGFSPDGKSLLTASLDHTARIWDAATGDPGPRVLPGLDAVMAAAFRPDGKMIVTAIRSLAQRWDANTLQPIGDPLTHKHDVNTVAFSLDGKTLLTATELGAGVWDADTGQLKGPVFRHGASIHAAAISPDGTKVLTAGDDKTAKIWNAVTGEAVSVIRQDAAIQGAAFSPDGQMIATGGLDGKVMLWNAETGGPAHEPFQHRAAVNGVAFSPDGKTLLTACGDRTAQLWDVESGRPHNVFFQHLDHVNTVAFSPDGRTISTGTDDGTARLWDPATGLALGPPMKPAFAGGVNAVAFSPDGRTLLIGFGVTQARLWRAPIPVEGTPERITLWVQVITGMELDADGVVQGLDPATWEQRRRRLEELGGPPEW